MGADHAINYSAERIDDGVRRLTSGRGVDVVVDQSTDRSHVAGARAAEDDGVVGHVASGSVAGMDRRVSALHKVGYKH